MVWDDFTSAETGEAISDVRLDFADLGKTAGSSSDTWWTALIDLHGVSIDDLMARLASDRPGAEADLVIPNDYTPDERAAAPEDQLIVAFGRADLLQRLNRDGAAFGVSAVHVGLRVPGDQVAPPAPPLSDEAAIRVPEGTVITAVIDDGIAFAHNLFRDGPTSTRVALAYIMDTPPETGANPCHGRLIRKKRIDQLLAQNTRNGLLDETQFYRDAGVINRASYAFNPVEMRRSHGTHIMALAAGAEMDKAPDTRPILCASLPVRVTEDTSGANLAPTLALALRVLSFHARRYRLPDGHPAPVVFNFSYGNFSGPHDGTGPITRLIEQELARHPKQPKRMVLPAGNGNLSRTHASVSFPNGQTDPVELRLMAQPQDRTMSYVELWMPYAPPRPSLPVFVKVRVTAPNGHQSAWIPAQKGAGAKLKDDQGREVARLEYRFVRFPTARGVMTLSLQPTFSIDTPTRALAPSGHWKIEVAKVDITGDQAVEVWISRDETLPGFAPLGRQAYFDNPCYERFDAEGAPLPVDPPGSDCPVRRAGTLSGFADGSSPMVVAGLVQSTGELAAYSSSGPITPTRGDTTATRPGPDAAARSDDSDVLSGVISAGSASGSMVRLNGTSVAAPRVTRLVADGLATGAAADRAWLCKKAQMQDKDFPPPKPEQTRAGCGRLDIDIPFEPPS
ncbi:MAG: hypothetical protein AAF376_03305 [Pseudomonadota bacterium]